MRSVHIVDDIPCTRRVIREGIESSLRASAVEPDSGEAIVTIDSEWKYIWDLLASGAIEKKDVVVSDLFPKTYWKDVPGEPLYDPVSPLPDDPTNIYLAALDAIQRFARKVPERGASLVMVTYVPNFLEKAMGTKEAADSIRDVLDKEEFAWFEKPDRKNSRENFAAAIAKACELVRG